MTQKIPVHYGQFQAIVDDEDYPLLSSYTWHIGATGHVVMYHQEECMMHRLIMQPPEALRVIHLNYDLLDHRRKNLRIVTYSQAIQRQKKRALTASIYKGVQLNPKSQRWRAWIFPEGQKIHLGYFEEELDAAKAYDEAALKYYGPDAWTNFAYESNKPPSGYIVPRRTTSSRYKGVARKPSGRFVAVLCMNGKRIHIGSFVNEVDAAIAYDKAALAQFGANAKLNFPEMYTNDQK